ARAAVRAREGPRAHAAAAREAGARLGLVELDRLAGLAGVNRNTLGRQPLPERGLELRIADGVAERGKALVGAFEERSSRAAFLRDVDRTDRGRVARPCADRLEELAAAVGEGQRSRIARARRARLEDRDLDTGPREQRRHRGADGTGADDGDARLRPRETTVSSTASTRLGHAAGGPARAFARPR